MSGEDRWKVWEWVQALLRIWWIRPNKMVWAQCGFLWATRIGQETTYVCLYGSIFFLINVCTLGLFGRIWSTACVFILTYSVWRLELMGWIAPTAHLWRPLTATKNQKQTGRQKPNKCCHQPRANRYREECPDSQERELVKEQTVPLSQPSPPLP